MNRQLSMKRSLTFLTTAFPFLSVTTCKLDWYRHIETDVFFFVLSDDSNVVFVELLAKLLDEQVSIVACSSCETRSAQSLESCISYCNCCGLHLDTALCSDSDLELCGSQDYQTVSSKCDSFLPLRVQPSTHLLAPSLDC